MHGNPQSPARKKPTQAVFVTYLFMKCEVMKKVLNPTTVLTLTVLSRSAGPSLPASQGAPPPLGTAQSATGDFKWLLARGCSQGWGETRKNPCYCKRVGWRTARWEPASARTWLKGPAGMSPFLISLKCSRTEPSPTAGAPHPSTKVFIYI